jgi:HEAT repeats
VLPDDSRDGIHGYWIAFVDAASHLHGTGAGSNFTRLPCEPKISPYFESRIFEAKGPSVLRNLRLPHYFAVMLGIVAALIVSGSGHAGALWGKIASVSSSQERPETLPAIPEGELDRLNPQQQAEVLLEHAVERSDGATQQIESHLNAWRGNLKWDRELGQLTSAALNSKDENVRDCAIEVQLAAYGVNKSDSTVDGLVRQANSSDQARKVWALWTLGLLANRGIETDRIVNVLSGYSKDFDARHSAGSEAARRWSVESLALVGTAATIPPLLDAMHNDPSASVRERATASLAESGMLSRSQRLLAVPQLISFSDDPALDAQTRTWAFQALGEITQERLPNSSAVWRDWYRHNSPAN